MNASLTVALAARAVAEVGHDGRVGGPGRPVPTAPSRWMPIA